LEKRVVITGLGAITPVGIGKENFYNALVLAQLHALMHLTMQHALQVK